MITLENPQKLKNTIEMLLARKQELENTRSISDIINDTFTQRWSVIEETKRSEFSKKVTRARLVVQLEVALVNAISDYVSPEFIEELNVGLARVRMSDDLKSLKGVYHKYRDDVKHRQVIKLISSIYRYNILLSENDKTSYFYISRSNLKSVIRYATLCPHCGEIAKQILQNIQRTKVVEFPE
jgi:hypothetical protein